jgi:hypothetical protein
VLAIAAATVQIPVVPRFTRQRRVPDGFDAFVRVASALQPPGTSEHATWRDECDGEPRLGGCGGC